MKSQSKPISSNTAPTIKTASAPPHTRAEDVAAIVTGVLIVSMGVALFAHAGLLTGGITGLAFALHYALGGGFGLWFFVLNLPFYWLAFQRMGLGFTVKTFGAVIFLSLLTDIQPQFFKLDFVSPAYAAIVGGLLAGVGMLILFRHRCSLGGVGIAAFYLQQRYGWPAGKVQMAVDGCILISSFFILPLDKALWSVAAALVLNQSLAINHRPGRYGS